MAVEHFYNAQILFGPWDISADHNEVQVANRADMKDVTRFGHVNHTFISGLRGLEIEGKGWVQIDDGATPILVDGALFAEVAGSAKAVTVAERPDDGATAYLGKIFGAGYSPTFKVGEPGVFEFKSRLGSQYTRGKILLPLATRTAAGPVQGTIYQLGALSATQKLLACLHVVEFNGTSLDVVVKSNDTNDTTTPTTRITFTQATGATSQFSEVSGPITDTYWYAEFTFVGTSFKAAVSAGIR